MHAACLDLSDGDSGRPSKCRLRFYLAAVTMLVLFCLFFLVYLLLGLLSPVVFPVVDSGGRAFFKMLENERRVWERFPHLTCKHPLTATQSFVFIGGTNFCNVKDGNTAMTISDNDPSSNRSIQLQIPISQSQMEQLYSFSRPSTVGRGEVDELDLYTRRSVEISASQLSSLSWPMQHAEWRILQQILANMMKQHSWLESPDGGERFHQLRLQKMLLYGPGDFFSRHRDSYKEDGMFATIIMLLPMDSNAGGPFFEGGALRITRTPSSSEASDSERVVEWHPSQTSTWQINHKCAYGEQFFQLPILHYSAFYSDCEHELQPVTSGHRVALVYNLMRNMVNVQ